MAKSGFAVGFAGFLMGVVTGLGIAAGTMLVISKSPMPFMDKVERVTADVDPAKKLAGGVDPNAKLNQQAEATSEAGDATDLPVKTVSASTDTTPKVKPPAQVFWVQIGAYRSKSDAEGHAADLAMQGIGAQVQAGGSAGWRVRVGPFDSRDAANEAMNGLSGRELSPVVIVDKK